MSFVLASLLNSHLSFTSLIHKDSPIQETLTFSNTGQSSITAFINNLSALPELTFLPARSSCASVSLIHPLMPHQTCTYVFQLLASHIPSLQEQPLNFTAIGTSSETSTQKFLVTAATYLYAASVDNVSAWDGHTWHVVGSSPSKVNALLLDAQNNLYAGGQNGINIWNGQAWTQAGEAPPLGVNALSFDEAGNLYAGTATGGVRRLAKNQSIWSPLGDHGPIDIMKMIYINDKHLLYVGTNDYTQVWNGQSWSLTPGAPLLGSVSFAYDANMHKLYTGTQAGSVYQLDLDTLQGWSLLGQVGDEYDLVDALVLTNQGLPVAGLDNENHSVKIYQGDQRWSDYGMLIPPFITTLLFDQHQELYAANYGGSADVFHFNTAQQEWEAIAGAPHNTIVNDLAIGTELKIRLLS